jgi:phage-related protein
MAAVEGISLPGVLGSAVDNMTNAEIAASFDAISGNIEKNSLLMQKMQQAMFDKRAEEQKIQLQQKIYDQLRINYDIETGTPRGKYGKIKEKVAIGFERLFKSKWFENTSKAFKKMADSLRSMSSGLLGTLVGLAVMAALDPSGELISGIIDTIANVFVMLLDIFVKLLPRIVDVIIVAGPRIAKAIIEAFKKLWDAFVNAFSKADGFGKLMLLALAFVFIIKVVGILVPIISGLISVFSFLASAISIGASIIGGLFTALGTIISIISSPITIIIGLFVLLYATLEPFRNAINKLFGVIKDIIIGFFTPIINFIKSIINAFKNFFSDLGKMSFGEALWNLVKRLVTALFNLFVEGFQFLFIELPKLLIKGLIYVLEALLAVLTWVVTSVIKVYVSIWNAIVGFFKKAWNWVKDFISSIFKIFSAEGFSGVAKRILDAITSALSGIGDFILDLLSTPFTTLKNMALALIDEIQSYFGGGSGVKKGYTDLLTIVKNTGMEREAAEMLVTQQKFKADNAAQIAEVKKTLMATNPKMTEAAIEKMMADNPKIMEETWNKMLENWKTMLGGDPTNADKVAEALKKLADATEKAKDAGVSEKSRRDLININTGGTAIERLTKASTKKGK